jgi:1,4-alpha-glucan branching enzyme
LSEPQVSREQVVACLRTIIESQGSDGISLDHAFEELHRQLGVRYVGRERGPIVKSARLKKNQIGGKTFYSVTDRTEETPTPTPSVSAGAFKVSGQESDVLHVNLEGSLTFESEDGSVNMAVTVKMFSFMRKTDTDRK